MCNGQPVWPSKPLRSSYSPCALWVTHVPAIVRLDEMLTTWNMNCEFTGIKPYHSTLYD